MKKCMWIPALVLSTFIGCFPLPTQAREMRGNFLDPTQPIVAKYTGYMLRYHCMQAVMETDHSELSRGYCYGVIHGVIAFLGDADRADIATGKKLATFNQCYPTLTTEKIIGVVLRYLRENPETRNEDEASVVMAAVGDAFPCPPAIR